MRKIVMVTLVLIAILPLLGVSDQVSAQQNVPAAAPANPETVIRAIFAALNEGDVDGAVALVAEDAVLVHIPPPPGVDAAIDIDKEGLRDWWNTFVERHGRIDITELYVHGDKVAFAANLSEDFFTAVGVPVMVAEVVAIVQGGLLESFTITFTPASGTIFDTAIARQENRAIIERLYEEVFNQKNLDVIDEIYADNVVDHDFGATTSESIKADLASMFSGLPDLQVTTDVWVVDGDLVTTRVTFSGTHQGEWMDVPATGNPVSWTHIDIHRIQDGRITDIWHTIPVGDMFQQIGFELTPSQ